MRGAQYQQVILLPAVEVIDHHMVWQGHYRRILARVGTIEERALQMWRQHWRLLGAVLDGQVLRVVAGRRSWWVGVCEYGTLKRDTEIYTNLSLQR